MSSSLRYDYDLPWPGVWLAVIFNIGISLILLHWAIHVGGILSVGPIFLSVIFALLTLWIIARRFIFSRVLELTEDAILFPDGFSGKRIKVVAYLDILRMCNTRVRPGLHLDTTKGRFEVMSVRFRDIESYRAVRAYICSKTSLSLSEDIPWSRDSGWVPGPVLKWSEPKDYIRYRTHLAVSKPLWLRLARTIRFFVCCFGFFFIPWLVLNFLLGSTLANSGFLGILIPACLFFTLLHWLFAAHPARSGHISVFKNGIHELSGKQTRDLNFDDCRGWSVVRREFEGQTFHILLLQRSKWVFEVAFPDADTRDRFIQILNDKKISQLNDLKPSWELKP